MLVARRLSSSQQCARTAKGANPTLGCIKHSTTSRPKGVIIPLYLALGWPHLEHCVHFWAPPLKKAVKVLGCIQRRATKLVKGLGGVVAEGQLRTRGLSSLEGRRLRGDLAALCSCLRREVERDVLSSAPWNPLPGRVGAAQSCVCQGRFGLGMRVVRPWDRLPGEVVDAPLYLSVLKRHLFGQCS